MTGALWAAVAGVGFGVFQASNRVALLGMSVVGSTALQLAISGVILAGLSVMTEDVSVLLEASPWAVVHFALAGIIHFAAGWTLMNVSQQRLGAARTGPLIATTPIFGTVVAWVTLGEVPEATTVAGILVIVAGAYVVGVGRARAPGPVRVSSTLGASGGQGVGETPAEGRFQEPGIPWRAAAYGLGTAVCWAISPIFTQLGLRDLPSPLLGVTVSMVAALAVYAVALLAGGGRAGRGWSRPALAWKVFAGVMVGMSTWARWYALSLTSVAVTLALSLLAVPTVVLLAPLMAGRHLERVTPALVFGSLLIVAGSVTVIL